MSTPRIPPVPPGKGGELDKTAPSSAHRKVEKVEKISKSAEVDDESRAKQFRQFVEAAHEEEESTLPTPFTLASQAPRNLMARTLFSSGERPPPQDPALAEAAENAVPNPSSSPAPATYLSGTSAIDENEETPALPRSRQFWKNVEEPDSDEPQKPPQMEENPRSSSRVFLTKEEEETGKKRKTPSADRGEGAPSLEGKPAKERKGARLERESPFGLPGKPTIDVGKEEILPQEKKKRSVVGPEGVIQGEKGVKYIGSLAAEVPGRAETKVPLPEAHERLGAQLGRAVREEEKIPGLGKESELRGKEKILEKEQAITKEAIREQEKEGGKKRSQKEKEEKIQIASPTTTPIPDFCLPMANAAAAAAKPYLGPEALAIYFHMIGTITAMVSPKGDSRTEFVLNAPSFADSKFYGATIAIERFSTAPYQLNILLTGTNAAVTAFNQNIPNLLSAFQNGNFSFTINRIETAYAKPLFHRKESIGEKGERRKGFGDGMDNSKK
jgi:hypothetical protein